MNEELTKHNLWMRDYRKRVGGDRFEEIELSTCESCGRLIDPDWATPETVEKYAKLGISTFNTCVLCVN